MKKLLFIFLFMPQLLCGQYMLSNGKTYAVGDTISIGRGSAVNGSFMYIQLNGLAMVSTIDKGGTTDDLNMDRRYSDLKAVIKKIVDKKIAGQVKKCFTIKMDAMNYLVYIESAIEAGEIK
jgi:hypothetical protein